MPHIRYVCLSDLHLGEEDSLLTNLSGEEIDPFHPSPVMCRLVGCLRHLIAENRDRQKPTLILNGDILELALGHENQAAMVFQRFIELIMPEGDELFEEIIFIPGNHDHHLWELARETQYLNHITSHLQPGSPLPFPWHATNLFIKPGHQPVPSFFLTDLVRCCRNVRNFQILTAYPNFGLLSEDGRQCIIFHHGHFIESLYHLMSTLKSLIFPRRKLPQHVWDIEVENFAWIDFFWSALGRSGEVGEEVEIIYEKMQDPEQFGKILGTLSQSIRKRYGFWHYLAAFILRFYLLRKMTGRERLKVDTLLSNDARKGLRAYVDGALRKQILLEQHGEMPAHMAFLFGHTHKPFQKMMAFKGYPEQVDLCNSGGWVVEGEAAQPLHGASVVLIDEHLETLSIRMFNERSDPAGYTVRVEEAANQKKAHSPFYTKIKGLVDPSAPPWKTFSETVAVDIRERIDHLRRRISQ